MAYEVVMSKGSVQKKERTFVDERELCGHDRKLLVRCRLDRLD